MTYFNTKSLKAEALTKNCHIIGKNNCKPKPNNFVNVGMYDF